MKFHPTLVCCVCIVMPAWFASAVPLLGADAAPPLRVLILSGANNHDWKQTTPFLRDIIAACLRFQIVQVLEDPTKLTPDLLARCDVMVSNWSAYPEVTGRQWGPDAEKAFLDWMRQGGGFVVFHAAAATSHDWPEFQQIIGVAFKQSVTTHTAYHSFRVAIDDHEHPITAGMPDFWIMDELYGNMVNFTDQQPTVLCRAFSWPDFAGTNKYEPIILTTRFGQGRGVNTVLGHDVLAMKNIAWQTIILRSAEWAATGKVTIPIPQDWPGIAAAAEITGLDKELTLKEVAAYRHGQPRENLAKLQNWVTVTASMSGERGEKARKDLADRLAAILASDATSEAKGFVLGQIPGVASAEHIPAVAKLLYDEQTAHSARMALSRMPFALSKQALLDALPKLAGSSLVGLINTLGDLRISESTKALADKLADNDAEVAQAAAFTLGKIGGEEARKCLQAAYTQATGAIQQAIGQALRACSDDAHSTGAPVPPTH